MGSKRFILFFLAVFLTAGQCFGQKHLEFPKFKSGEIIVHHTGHVLSYNSDWLIPNWVAYELKAEELEGDAERQRSFSPDPKLEKYSQAEHWNYTNSGWVRGHMIPAGDVKYSQEAMNDTFYTSNVCPMNMKFNNSIWKRLEEKTRSLAREFGCVYVITGPIMSSNANGKVGVSDIMIPDMFFKALLVPKNGYYYAIGFIMENSETTNGKLKDFAVTIDELEKILDLDLFHNMDNMTENKVEKHLPLKELGLY